VVELIAVAISRWQASVTELTKIAQKKMHIKLWKNSIWVAPHMLTCSDLAHWRLCLTPITQGKKESSESKGKRQERERKANVGDRQYPLKCPRTKYGISHSVVAHFSTQLSRCSVPDIFSHSSGSMIGTISLYVPANNLPTVLISLFSGNQNSPAEPSYNWDYTEQQNVGRKQHHNIARRCLQLNERIIQYEHL